jgi:hypothetical protein
MSKIADLILIDQNDTHNDRKQSRKEKRDILMRQGKTKTAKKKIIIINPEMHQSYSTSNPPGVSAISS